MSPARHTVQSVRGLFPPLVDGSVDFDREIEEAMSDHADVVMEQMKRR